jgi:eukaryotic-like serine/threonine-protein kinase
MLPGRYCFLFALKCDRLRPCAEASMQAVERLGKYQIRGTLGRGAMGLVYEGWDPSIQRRVAIKTVSISDAAAPETEEQLARFRREAQAAGRLVHPNIISIHDYGETAEIAYIVMEYVEGPTLKSLLDARERFSLPIILRIMRDVLAGLEFSHGRGVVHRDIKPANVMLTSEDAARGHAKIADFGIARIESSNMTQAGTMMGTPSYMSPEQFMGQAVDARTDIYSAGVMLYQLLTGDRPFEGGLSAIMHKVLTIEPPAPSALSVIAPPLLDVVVRTAMAKRPDDRFRTAAAFSAALEAAVSAPAAGAASEDATIVVPATGAAAGRSRHEPSVIQRPPRRNLVPVMGAVVAVVLMLGGGSAYFLPWPAREAFRPPAASAVGNSAAGTATLDPPPAESLPSIQGGEAAPPGSLPAAKDPAGVMASPFKPGIPDPPPRATATPAMIRDRLAPMVAGQPCALIEGSVSGSLQVALHGIAGPGVQDAFQQAAARDAVPGTIQWNVESADSGFCRTLDLLRSIALPFGAAGPRLAVGLADGRTALRDGERIRPRVVMPDFPGYLRVDYIGADGNVQHLYPQSTGPGGTGTGGSRTLAPGERVNLGDPMPGQPAWGAGEPYGTDMIIAIASAAPLFGAPRPADGERAEEYLRDLEAAVAAARAVGVRVTGSAVLVETLAK